jgi:hypothetical protein
MSQTPIGYHYANHPALSVDRVREVVFTNFDISEWLSSLEMQQGLICL